MHARRMSQDRAVLVILASIFLAPTSSAQSTQYFSDYISPRGELGRLFSTQKQRERSDEELLASLTSPNDNMHALPAHFHTGDVDSVSEKTDTRIENIEFSGYVIRSDGQHLVWLDGKSHLSEKFDAANYVKSKPNQVSGKMILGYQGERKRLKPGQIWILNNGQVKESYEVERSLPVKKPVTQSRVEPTNTGVVERRISDEEKPADPNLPSESITSQDIKKILGQIKDLQEKLRQLEVPNARR